MRQALALHQHPHERALRPQDFIVRRLEPLHARLEAQAERIGRLELELETAKAQLAKPTSTNGRTHEDAAPEWERRSWWQRLVWG